METSAGETHEGMYDNTPINLLNELYLYPSKNGTKFHQFLIVVASHFSFSYVHAFQLFFIAL
jgi:hypothetical protein